MPAHRQAAGGLDEEDRRVGIFGERRIEEAARHHVMTARLEHQPGADPVIFCEKVLAALQHGRAGKRRNATAAYDSDRIPACVSVDAEECMS